jgi:ubiquinone biosynthesis protein
VPPRFPFRGPLPEILRARRIAEVLIRNGLGFVAERMGLTRFLPFWRSRTVGADAHTARLPFPVRFRRTLEELGPTYIKLGQVLSTRPDLLPPDYIVELSKLLDAAPPAPTAEVVATIEEELARPLGSIFLTFSETPTASASIGQVHRATLFDGTEVVVKVQRRGVDRVIQTDLNILLAQARFLEGRSEALRRYHVAAIIEELAEALRGETDYTREGRQADTLRALSARDEVRIPRVYWDYTTRRVITLEHLDGIQISEPDRLRATGHNLGDIARRLAAVYLTHVFEHGVFHADPHPANILVLDGHLGLIDFGSVGYLSPTMRDQLGDLLFALVQQDADDMVYAIMSMGALGPGTDRDGLRAEVQRLIGRYYGATLESVPIADFLGDMMGAALRHEVRMPADLALLVRTVVVLEGVVRGLDPSLDLTTFIEPFARRLIRQRLSLRRAAMAGARTLRDVEALAHVLPRRLDTITEQLERGKMTIGFQIQGLPSALRKLDAIANRLSFAIIVAALVVGSALVLAAGPEAAFRIPFTSIALPIPEMGFVIAALMGAWLLFSIVRSRGL